MPNFQGSKTMKMAKNVDRCKDCPHRISQDCGLVKERISDTNSIPAFCPLPNYPSSIIASLENTVRYYQSEELKKYTGFSQILMQHIAAGFKVPIYGFASVELKVKEDGKEKNIFLRHDHIRDVDAQSSSLTFFYGEDVYKVSRGRDHWEIQKAVMRDGKELWMYVTA